MASREKKTSATKKSLSASPIPPKEIVVLPEKVNTSGNEEKEAQAVAVAATSATKTALVGNKITKNVAKKCLSKKGLAVSFKAKAKNPKLNPKVKALLDIKKAALLNNGIKPKSVPKPKSKVAVIKQNRADQASATTQGSTIPVDADKKKVAKKRPKKTNPSQGDISKKVKVEIDNDLSSIDRTIDFIIRQYAESESSIQPKKAKVRKPKMDSTPAENLETLEDVMNDLSSLIKSEEANISATTTSEPAKSEANKTKRSRKKADNKQKALTKENIENYLNKKVTLDASANQLIDMLDLNVQKSRNASVKSRRHSIEKFPVILESNDYVLNNVPRSVTPKLKRIAKVKQKLGISPPKQPNQCITRSDSAVSRTLRNGRHSKGILLEGLVDFEYKKRNKKVSELIGLDNLSSKLSDYESDGSFSDQKDPELFIKCKIKDEVLSDIESTTGSPSTKSDKLLNPVHIHKRTASTEAMQNGEIEIKLEAALMDSNSNLCNDLNKKGAESSVLLDAMPKLDEALLGVTPRTPLRSEADDVDFSSSIPSSPSLKVPEKSIILDIMKHTFNDVAVDDNEKRATRAASKITSDTATNNTEVDCSEKRDLVSSVPTSQFYGSSATTARVNPSFEESIVYNEIGTFIEASPDTVNDEVAELVKHINSDGVNVSNEAIDASSSNNATSHPLLESLLETSTVCDLPKSKDEEDAAICEITSESGLLNAADGHEETKPDRKEDSIEDLAVKENILQALGLQSLKAAEEAKLKEKPVQKNDYTGTLKTVIKLNRIDKKKTGSSLKVSLQKSKRKTKPDWDQVTEDDDHIQKNREVCTIV